MSTHRFDWVPKQTDVVIPTKPEVDSFVATFRHQGLEAPLTHVRPFADLYLIDILDREGAVGVNLLMGLQLPIPLQ